MFASLAGKHYSDYRTGRCGFEALPTLTWKCTPVHFFFWDHLGQTSVSKNISTLESYFMVEIQVLILTEISASAVFPPKFITVKLLL